MSIIERLRERIAYNPRTGALTWKERAPSSFSAGKHSAERRTAMFNARYAGKPALNCPNGKGYLVGMFEGHPLKAHHAAWMIHYGTMPPAQIDHRNGDGSDNRIRNFRAANHGINAKNRAIPKNNTTGRIGVYPKEGKWGAKIGRTHLGTFGTKRQASAARRAAELELGYHRNHGRKVK